MSQRVASADTRAMAVLTSDNGAGAETNPVSIQPSVLVMTSRDHVTSDTMGPGVRGGNTTALSRTLMVGPGGQTQGPVIVRRGT